ncbi:MAG TPA: GNAT family N-acetyltransferase [Candidatus Thermoplasmatota archaeon]
MGLGRMLRPAASARGLEVSLEASLPAPEAAPLIEDYQARLARNGALDVRGDLRALFESPAHAKVVSRSPSGAVEGAAVLTSEAHASDIAFLHVMPRHASDAATAALLDAALAALPAGTTKVRAQVTSAGRWLHLPPARGRALLAAQGFLPLARALMLRDLTKGLPAPPPVPAGYTVVPPDPSRSDEWSRFALEAYRGTTDFAVITLEESEAAYRRLYARFLGGEFGPYARGMSFAAVPEGGAGPAAVLHTVFVGPDPYVGDLSVHPAHRRRGLGRALLLRALSAYAAAGAKRAGLTATEQNRPAYALYRSVGFQVARSSEVFIKYL